MSHKNGISDKFDQSPKTEQRSLKMGRRKLICGFADVRMLSVENVDII